MSSEKLVKKPILFIDRDGVILQEPPTDYQIDAVEKMRFVPGAITALSSIAKHLTFYTVMVTNQDGMGTESFPAETFYPYQQLMLDTLVGEGFTFNEVHVDTNFEKDNTATRKPGIGMVQHLINEGFDIENSYVIGDRWSDVQLAVNIGCKAILFSSSLHTLTEEQQEKYANIIALATNNWQEIFSFLKLPQRVISHQRHTNETQIDVYLNLDGQGKSYVDTGLGFFNHMLEQIAKHGGIEMHINTKGDLHIDEHHTIEDTGLALGEAFAKVLADKRGMERYGYALPMDEAEAKVLIDFGGRPWLVWDAAFKREKVGDMPTEMFYHFFKSFADASKCNLNISCNGDNEHHKIEAIFKAFAKAIKMAIKRDVFSNQLPSTKGVL